MSYIIINDENGLTRLDNPNGTIITGPVTHKAGTKAVINLISADGAISPSVGGTYVITKGSAAALTLAAPTADGLSITVASSTAFAHVLTATGLLQTGSANVNVATFAAFAGAKVRLMSYNGKWMATNDGGITFS